MRTRVLVLLAAGALLIVAYTSYSITQGYRAPTLPSQTAKFVTDHVLGFSDQMATGFSKEEVSEVRMIFSKARDTALAKATTAAWWRDALRIAAHVSAGLALLATLAIALIGAARGVTLSNPPTKEQLDSLGRNARSTRRSAFIVAALSAFFIALGDRLTVYASNASSTVNDIVQTIQSADEAVSKALNPDEVKNAANVLAANLLRM